MGQKRIFLDTMVFIYYFSNTLPYSNVIYNLLTRVKEGYIEAVTSAVTIAEIFTKPERENNFYAVLSYEIFLKSFPNLEIVSIDWNVARTAAKIRACYPEIKTPDSLQVATALYTDCSIFLTNDKQLKKIKEIEVKLILEAKNILK